MTTTTTDYRALCAALLDEIGHESPTTCLARAALAQPEPEGLTAAELSNLWRACSSPSVFARAILARWGRPAIKPVPVSERPWEREGWCDADGCCWWGRPSEELCNSDWFLATRAEVEEFCDCFPPVVSLPHHALPVPETQSTRQED